MALRKEYGLFSGIAQDMKVQATQLNKAVEKDKKKTEDRKKNTFVSPEGRVYKWTKSTPPTQEDYDAMAEYDKNLKPVATTQYTGPLVPGERERQANREKAALMRKRAAADHYLNPDSDLPVPLLSSKEIDRRVNEKQTQETFSGGQPKNAGDYINRFVVPENDTNTKGGRLLSAVGQTLTAGLKHNFEQSGGMQAAAQIPDSHGVIAKLSEIQASLLNPLNQVDTFRQAVKDPAGMVVDTGLAINKIWRKTDESGNPISIEDRIDGLVALGGTALAVAGVVDNIKGLSVVQAARAKKALLAKGVKPGELEAALAKSAPKFDLPEEAPKPEHPDAPWNMKRKDFEATGEDYMHGTPHQPDTLKSGQKARMGNQPTKHVYFTKDETVANRFASAGRQYSDWDSWLDRTGDTYGDDHAASLAGYRKAIQKRLDKAEHVSYSSAHGGEEVLKNVSDISDVDLTEAQIFYSKTPPNVIKTKLYGRTIDLTGDNIPEDVPDWIKAYGNKKGIPNFNHEYDPKVSKWMRENHVGKLIVGDTYESGFKSTISIDEFIGHGRDPHREFVANALKEGKTVPPEVLADYPDLAPKGQAPKTEAAPKKTKSGFSNKKQIAALTDEFGYEPVSKSGTTLQEAQKTAIESGKFDQAEKIAHDVLNQKRVMTDVEQIAVSMKGKELSNQLKDASKVLDDAIDKGDQAAIKAAQGHYDDLYQRAETVADAVTKSGSEWGKAGNARKIIVNEVDPTDTFSMEQQFKRQAGRKATDAEKVEIKKLSDENKAVNERLKAAEDQLAAMQAGEVVKSTKRVKRAPQDIHAEIDSLLKEFKANRREGTTINALPRVDIAYKQGVVLAKLASNYIQLGIQSLPALVAKIKSHFPDLKDREIHDAIAGNYPKPAKAPMSETAKVKAEIKTEARLESKLADLNDQLSTGNVRPPTTKEIKAQSKAIEDLRAQVKLKQAQARQYLANQRPQSALEKTRTIIRAGRLTNPIARIQDVVSNTVVGVTRYAGKPVEAVIDRLLFPKLRQAEGAASVGWSVERAKQVAAGSVNRWKNEIVEQMAVGDPALNAKYGSRDLNTKSAALNTVVNKINRFAGVTDVPFKDTIYRGVASDLAEAKARQELGKGASKADVSARQKQIFDEAINGKGHEEIHMIAEDEAIKQVFGGDNWTTETLGDLDRRLKSKGVKGEAALLIKDIFVQFPRIFTNISGYATDFAVGGGKALLKGAAMKAEGVKFSTAERRVINRLVTRNMQGVALYFIGQKLYQEGIIKPDFHKEGGFVDYGDLAQVGGPVSILLLSATWAAIEDEDRGTPLSDSQKKAFKWGTALDLIANQPLIESPMKTVDKLQRGDVAGAVVAPVSRALIPAGIREWARRQDQWTNKVGDRKARGPLQQAYKNLPFLREGLQPAK